MPSCLLLCNIRKRWRGADPANIGVACRRRTSRNPEQLPWLIAHALRTLMLDTSGFQPRKATAQHSECCVGAADRQAALFVRTVQDQDDVI
jgi:hypothetical protein